MSVIVAERYDGLAGWWRMCGCASQRIRHRNLRVVDGADEVGFWGDGKESRRWEK